MKVSGLKKNTPLSRYRVMVQSATERLTSAGRPFVSFVLQDDSGTIDAKFWGMKLSDLPVFEGAIVFITGIVGEWEGKADIKLSDVRLAEGQNDYTNLIPCSPMPIDAMWGGLVQIVNAVESDPIRRLLVEVMSNYERKLIQAPASMKLHHAYMGGLLEHILSLCGLGACVAMHYNVGELETVDAQGYFLDRDYLVAAAILHDIGKVEELTAVPIIRYTTQGKLIGHIVLGLQITSRMIAAVGVPDDVEERILHIITSHHGTLEWGSPVVPKTLEAVVFHQLDMLDSRFAMVSAALKDTPHGEWSPFHTSMKQEFMRVDDRPAAEELMDDGGPAVPRGWPLKTKGQLIDADDLKIAPLSNPAKITGIVLGSEASTSKVFFDVNTPPDRITRTDGDIEIPPISDDSWF